MNNMRELLDAKDWLVIQDTQSQREILDGQCVQLIVHFYGKFYFHNSYYVIIIHCIHRMPN